MDISDDDEEVERKSEGFDISDSENLTKRSSLDLSAEKRQK